MEAKWYYCPKCGFKIAKYDPLEAICSAVYVKCRQCKETVEIRCKKPQDIVKKSPKRT